MYVLKLFHDFDRLPSSICHDFSNGTTPRNEQGFLKVLSDDFLSLVFCCFHSHERHEEVKNFGLFALFAAHYSEPKPKLLTLRKPCAF